MTAIKTGNYRAVKQKIGYSGTKEVIVTGTLNEVNEFLLVYILEEGYSIYKEEEVIFKNTLKDENGNSLNSAPTWRHF